MSEAVNFATSSTKLSELTNSSGTNLSITSGNLVVYKNGIRNTISISTTDTLQSLSEKLSDYNISMRLNSDGTITLRGEGDSYVSADVTNATNLLSKLGISSWKTSYNSSSKPLTESVNGEGSATMDSKLTELLSSSGSSLGITTGTYYIYENGVRITETITSDTTIGDFLTTLQSHGITANISSDGSISLSGNNNTYLASASSGSNIVDKLFPNWQFINTYSDPIKEVHNTTQTATTNTKLSAIDDSYTPGTVNILNNGVTTTITLTSDETIGTFLNKLNVYGFTTSLDSS